MAKIKSCAKGVQKTRKGIIFIIITLVSFITGCKQKLVEKITVTIVVSKDIEIQKQDTVTELIKNISNYYSFADTVLIPSVIVSRIDLNQTLNIEIPLSGSNKFRNSIGLLSVKELMANYDNEIPKLILPDILKSKGNKIIAKKEMFVRYPNAQRLPFNLSKKSIDSLKYRFADSLVSNKLGTSITFILDSRDSIIPYAATTTPNFSLQRVPPLVKPKEVHETTNNQQKVPYEVAYPHQGTFTNKYKTINGKKYKLMNDGKGGYYICCGVSEDTGIPDIAPSPDSLQHYRKVHKTP